jgi:peptidoglycan hydrolase-like protein with peptidoglycan-binding domain
MASFFIKDKQAIQAIQQASAGLNITAQGAEVVVAFQTDAAPLTSVVAGFMKQTQAAAAGQQGDNNLKQIGLAMHNYLDTNRSFPPQTVGKGLSWRVAILPFLEQETLYRQFKLDEPWDSPHNKALIPLMPEVYKMPSRAAAPGQTYYQTFVGPKTSNPTPTKGLGIAGFRDGTSNTIIVAEAGVAVEWTRPEDIKVDPDAPITLGRAAAPAIPALLADGSVRQLPRKLDQKTLRLLIDPADGQPVEVP